MPPVVAQAEARLQAGLVAADEGHLDRARAEFDGAIDLLLGHPGGAFADPRVAEAYRRMLDTVHIREIEMLAAGDGFTETGTEPASIDAVASLPVGEAPAGPETLARAVAAVESETLDLPVELNEPVLSCIDLYQGRLRPWFETALSRGQQYMPHIREVFAEEGIPRDLAYVALVESAFKTTAYSRAKAKGVWQFISATGKRYGLDVDWWVDERSDPEKATRAAARYLKDLYALFGDWNLALAGYNAGEGKVLRAIRRYKTDDFWALRKTRGLRPRDEELRAAHPRRGGAGQGPGALRLHRHPGRAPRLRARPDRGRLRPARDRRVRGRARRGDPHPEPRASAARHPRRPHLLAARPARPGADRGGVRRGPAAREAGQLPQASWCGAARRSRASPGPTARPPATWPRPTTCRCRSGCGRAPS